MEKIPEVRNCLKRLTEHELDMVFQMGECPDALSLLGPEGAPSEWRVDMLNGLLPNLAGWPFHHRKLFYYLPTDAAADGCPRGIVGGCNLMFGKRRWGHFLLDDEHVFSDNDKKLVLFIDYDQSENGFATRDIRDYVRTTNNPDLLLGEFWYGRSRSHFTLTRLPDARIDPKIIAYVAAQQERVK